MARGKRREYLNDFHRDLNGNYQYEGKHLRYTGPVPRRRALAGLWARCGAALAALLVAGVLPVPGAMQRFYVLLPYAGAVVVCVSALWALARVTAGGDPLRAYLYEQAAAKLPFRCGLAAVLAAAAAVGEGVDLCLHGAQNAAAPAAAYLALTLAAALLLWRSRTAAARMTYEEQ